MDNKSNFIASKTAAVVTDIPKGLPPLKPVSSAEIRNDFDKAAEAVADVADDAQTQVTEAADTAQQTVSRVADKVQKSSQKAIEVTRDYATTAVNAAGKKVREVQGQYDTAKSTATGYINEDPVRAVKYAAIGSAVLTAALIGIFRRR
jgi:vacuolar-type H+-ATPase subunit H